MYLYIHEHPLKTINKNKVGIFKFLSTFRKAIISGSDKLTGSIFKSIF